MDSAKLIALAERCEAADGPSYALECAIHDELLEVMNDEQQLRLPAYTASLDAAMQLVPERWKLRQMHFNAPCADDRKWHLNLHGGKVGEDYFVGRSKSPALALCAASLRARAAMENNHD